MADHRNNSFDTKIRRQQGSQKLLTHYTFKLCKTLTGIIAKAAPNIWKSRAFCYQSKKDVNLEVKFAKIR